MNKTFLILIVILIIIGCNDVINKVTIDDNTGRSMLIGVTDRSAFELPDFKEWVNDEYTAYEPDEFILKQIKELSDSIVIQIFMGTWCSDSRREVPRFLKILDLAGFEQSKLQIINVDRNKKSPTHDEKNKKIEYVPTFILNRNSIEIGRIMEFPIVTLESDLLSILLEIDP